MIGNDSSKHGPPSDDDVSTSEIPDDPRIIAVVKEYLQELDAGRMPNRDRFVQRFPELSAAISRCLDGLELMHGGKPDRLLVGSTQRRSTPDAVDDRLAKPLGDFQIVKELARGGMGIVYEAIQLSLGRRVALKVLPFASTMDARHLQRFKIETQAAALLHHTHIVPIHAVGCERGLHFYAMQLIQGDSLATVIKQMSESRPRSPHNSRSFNTGNSSSRFSSTTAVPRNDGADSPVSRASTSTLDLSRTLGTKGTASGEQYFRHVSRLMIQAATALDHAHQSGVVHRDIKPANLLLDVAGNIWITDFGLAQLQSENGITRSGDFVGTLRYMSPEQIGGQRSVVDHRADLYSLGATFYEILTLEPAFPGENYQELLYQVLHTEPCSLRHWNRAVPPELETIVLKAISKNPSDRYGTAAEFAADIQRYLDHKPILAKRPSLVDRARKWSRRHPSIVVAAGLLLLAIALASLASNRLIALEQKRTEEALEREKDRANEAEKSFQQARQAVDALFQISQEELADKPVEGARKRILEIVLSYYEDFIEHRANNPASQFELTRAQNEVKKILREMDLLQREMHHRLLESDAVAVELELSDESRQELRVLLKKWALERQEFFDVAPNMSDDARRAHMVERAKSHEEALTRLFSARQRERFRQISLQSQGISAFKEPEIVRALGLTSEQRAQIRQIERDYFLRAFRPHVHRGEGDNAPGGPPGLPPEPGFGGPPPWPPGRPSGADQAFFDAVDTVLGILTPEQQEKWYALAGAKFARLVEVPFFGPPRPFRP